MTYLRSVMVFLRGEVRRAVFLCIDTSKQKRKKLRKFPVFDLTQKKSENKVVEWGYYAGDA